MRYIILKKISNKEIKSRIDYIKNVFNIYVIPHRKEELTEFISIPSNSIDVIVIIGHNNDVYEYIKDYKPKEKVLVLITCYLGKIKKINLQKKQAYISKNICGITETYEGNLWGFQFDITDSELDLFNEKQGTIYQRINKSFERIN